jgi:ribosomal protein L11 methyltransferase
MDYTEVTFHVTPRDEEVAGILAALLAGEGFEGFVDTDDGFKGYIPAGLFSPGMLERVDALPVSRGGHVITREVAGVEDRDWNRIWEESFTPVVVAGRLRVRAGFHEPVEGMEHDIVIDPKMSFGTGHHATTALMLEAILDMEAWIAGREVLDMGCGTGILAIMASRVGAARVTGVDIDERAYRNALENVERNGAANVALRVGDGRLLEGEERYDLILANISRNVLVEEMPRFAGALRGGGKVVTSGFYPADLPRVREGALAAGFRYEGHRAREGWCAAIFNKPSAIR